MSKKKMGMPPPILDCAQVLKYAVIDSSVIHTGKRTLIVGGKIMSPADGIAICKYKDEADYLVLYCNENWESFGASGHPSIEDAMKSLEKGYKGITEKWRDMPQSFSEDPLIGSLSRPSNCVPAEERKGISLGRDEAWRIDFKKSDIALFIREMPTLFPEGSILYLEGGGY